MKGAARARRAPAAGSGCEWRLNPPPSPASSCCACTACTACVHACRDTLYWLVANIKGGDMENAEYIVEYMAPEPAHVSPLYGQYACGLHDEACGTARPGAHARRRTGWGQGLLGGAGAGVQGQGEGGRTCCSLQLLCF